MNHLIRVYILDPVFGAKNFRNEIVWNYHSGGASKQHFSRKHDSIFWYSKSDVCTYNIQREPYRAVIAKKRQALFNPDGKMLEDVWDVGMMSTVSPERIGYPTQKPEALLERIIRASS